MKVGTNRPPRFRSGSRDTFPGRELLVIGGNEFETQHIKGVTVEQFLLADGLPHPYPGEMEIATWTTGKALSRTLHPLRADWRAYKREKSNADHAP